MRDVAFIGALLIFALIGCDQEEEKSTLTDDEALTSTETYNVQPKSEVTNIPMFILEEYTIGGDTIYMDLVDSSLLLNPVITQQAIIAYAIKMGTRKFEFEDLYIQLKLPNRAQKLNEYHIGNKEFHQMVNHFKDKDYAEFINEILVLNASTSDNYDEKSSSLLDGINLIFGVQIEEKYPDEFPTNTHLFGYDSFQIFWKYFNECSEGTPWIGHELIKGIYVSKGVLNQKDKLALMLIVQRYNGIFSDREEAYS